MSIYKWIDKEAVAHIYSGLLALKRNEFESVEVRCMNLEIVLQSEVKSEREKQISCMAQAV